MEKKRMFQVFDEMNANDEKNGTQSVGICNQLVSGQKVKNGATVTMGIPFEALMKIESGEYTPLLILLDKSEYDKIQAKDVG